MNLERNEAPGCWSFGALCCWSLLPNRLLLNMDDLFVKNVVNYFCFLPCKPNSPSLPSILAQVPFGCSALAKARTLPVRCQYETPLCALTLFAG